MSLQGLLRLNGVSTGRRWSVAGLESALSLLALVAVDALAAHANIIRCMFHIDRGVYDLLLRTFLSSCQAQIKKFAALAARLIEANPTKSARAVAVHAWTNRSSCGLWLTALQRAWSSACWLEQSFARDRIYATETSIPPGVTPTGPRTVASVVTTPTIKVAEFICRLAAVNKDWHEARWETNTTTAVHSLVHASCVLTAGLVTVVSAAARQAR